MKTKRLYYAYLIGILIILPIVNSVSVIAQGADYIGIDENDEFIWNLTYDEDQDEELGDDLGYNTTYF